MWECGNAVCGTAVYSQEKLSKPPESRTPPDQQLRSERDRLTETNTELRGKLETSEGRLRDLEIECQRYSYL